MNTVALEKIKSFSNYSTGRNTPHLLKQLIVLISLPFLTLCCKEKGVDSLIAENVKLEEMVNWSSLDKGKMTVKDDQLIMEEISGADGFFVISPKSYEGDLVLNYQAKALSESSVMIVLFSASDQDNYSGLKLPASQSQESLRKWRANMSHYNMTFNNRSHNYTPFMYKNVNALERGFYLRKSENIMSTERWYDIEVGNVAGRLWLKIDGELVFDHQDPQPLNGGHLIFRISGTNGENTILAKMAIKSVVINHE